METEFENVEDKGLANLSETGNFRLQTIVEPLLSIQKNIC